MRAQSSRAHWSSMGLPQSRSAIGTAESLAAVSIASLLTRFETAVRKSISTNRKEPYMALLEQHDLHRAVRDPALNVPVFHTEVMSRFPDAISFAPGAPNLTFATDFDVAKYTDRYL